MKALNLTWIIGTAVTTTAIVGISARPTLATWVSWQIIADTDTVFTIIGTGSAIDKDATYPPSPLYISPSGFWQFRISSLVERDNIFNDTLAINGLVQHIKSPVGHTDGVGVPLVFRLAVDADNAAGSPLIVSDTDSIAEPHGSHEDTLAGLLNADVDNTPFTSFDNISNYSFTVDVRHCSTNNPRVLTDVRESADSCPANPPRIQINVPIPPERVSEPSSVLSFLAIGTLGAGSIFKRQGKRKNR